MAHRKSDATKAAVRADMNKREIRKRENMTQHNFRMTESDYRKLEEHFEDLGLSISAGLRMVLKKYMQDEGIR